jgi:hypothetical protein
MRFSKPTDLLTPDTKMEGFRSGCLILIGLALCLAMWVTLACGVAWLFTGSEIASARGFASAKVVGLLFSASAVLWLIHFSEISGRSASINKS